MGFDSLLRSGVSLIDSLTGSMQCTVTWYAYTGQDGFGKKTFASGVLVPATVDQTAKQVQHGEHLVTIKATIIVPRPVAPNGTVTDPPRNEPFDPRDKIMLPDGTTAPILDTPGSPTDPTTGRGYFAQLLLADL